MQCSAYDDQPYDGETVEWHPYYDEESPCTLMCVDSKGRVEEMSPRVRDGTRCRLGSLDMCIDGVCQVSSVTYRIPSVVTNRLWRIDTPQRARTDDSNISVGFRVASGTRSRPGDCCLSRPPTAHLLA